MNYLDSTKQKITIPGLVKFAMWMGWLAVGICVTLTAYGALYPYVR